MASVVQFSQAQAGLARYWYERLQYTWGPRNLDAVVQPQELSVFSVGRINKTDIPGWVASLKNIAATQDESVMLEMKFDGRAIPCMDDQGRASAMPAGVRPVRFLDLPAVRSMSLMVRNESLLGITNFQLNYQVSMKRLTVLDKLILGITQFTKDEEDALKDQSIGLRDWFTLGKRTIRTDEEIEQQFKSRLVYSESRLVRASQVKTTDYSFLTVRATEAGSDCCVILRELAIEGAPNVVVSVDRDDDVNYMGVHGGAFVHGDDEPWDVFIPAIDHLTFHAQALAGTIDVPVRIGLWHVRMSDAMRVKFGLARRGEVPDDLYLRVVAGVA